MARRIRIEGTDLLVSRLSFGTGSLHHLFRRTERLRVLSAALDAGITHFDTSPLYGFGLAEHDLGQLLSGRLGQQVTLASKVGLYPPRGSRPTAGSVWIRKFAGRLAPSLSRSVVDWSISRAQTSLETSLARCRREVIDLLLLHEPEAALIDSDDFLNWLERRRSAGQIRHWGVAGETETVRAWAAERHELAPVVQTRDSLDRRNADFLTAAGRPLQLTYGYMRALGRGERSSDVYQRALARNSTGSIIVSTRDVNKVREMAGVLSQ